MILFQIYILVIALLVACSSALLGVFLVLRGVALMSDAISHALLPGIIIMFLLVRTFNSPFLLIGAAVAGLLTVISVEFLIKVKNIKKDTAIGLVFPLFFAIGVILIHIFAHTIHIDTDMVLLGEIAFAPFNRLYIGARDVGPYALWLLSFIMLINAVFVWFCYKELKLTTFDPLGAKFLGFNAFFINYGIMFLTSITMVGAFDIVGSIVVVALTITPAATAYLLTDRLNHMISMSLLIAASSVITGYTWAFIADISIAGAIATMSGIFFIAILCIAPRKGLAARASLYAAIKRKSAIRLVFEYIRSHGSIDIVFLPAIFGWSSVFVDQLIASTEAQNLFMRDGSILSLHKL